MVLFLTDKHSVSNADSECRKVLSLEKRGFIIDKTVTAQMREFNFNALFETTIYCNYLW